MSPNRNKIKKKSIEIVFTTGRLIENEWDLKVGCLMTNNSHLGQVVEAKNE